VAQLQWTIISNRGQRYRLGLYHGDHSGHLMVHCNSRVMIVDFGIRDSKTYTFFIDEQLYELRLRRENGRFSYACVLNEEAETPLNQAMKASDRRDWWRVLLLALGFIAVISTVVILIQRERPSEREAYQERLAAGEGAAGELRLARGVNGQWRYSFLAGSRIQEGRLAPADTLMPYGFPLLAGDDLTLRYLPRAPRHFIILWDQPSAAQLERYAALAAGQHHALHPELAERQVRCQVQLAYELQGLAGLAAIYQQAVPPDSFPDHNRHSYLRLVRSPEWQRAVGDCL
jgi:hypothetical protein